MEAGKTYRNILRQSDILTFIKQTEHTFLHVIYVLAHAIIKKK